jgi:hypothetical protein
MKLNHNHIAKVFEGHHHLSLFDFVSRLQTVSGVNEQEAEELMEYALAEELVDMQDSICLIPNE